MARAIYEVEIQRFRERPYLMDKVLLLTQLKTAFLEIETIEQLVIFKKYAKTLYAK